ncbi:hypothetical protein L2E82_29242 [Cichorium intybus]|uniref:Uncharacterized protein n=1 Tax=Cichorium intybus TaxID=13427 RepID=A0ACB9CX95_CICIN|nr:hypothetical protein L2E82_29242 [Cichorium intybus]
MHDRYEDSRELIWDRVIEDPSRSLSMGPKIWNHDFVQSSEEEWSDADDDGLGSDAHEYYEEDRICNLDFGQIKSQPNKYKPTLNSLGENKSNESIGGPAKADIETPVVPDLNNSPQSSRFFSFVDIDDNMEEDFDFSEEAEVEQAITDAIERKRRHKKKGSRKSQNKGANKSGSKRSNKICRESISSHKEEINQTIKIGEELGIQFNGNQDVVEKVVYREGATLKR